MSLLVFKAPVSAAAEIPSTPDQVLKSPSRTSEVYTQAKQSPFATYFGRLFCPDPTIAKFGGGRGFDLYYDVRRQITELSGIIGQLVDGALKRRPTIVPGDPSNDESVQVADDMRRIWDDIPGKAVALRKTVDTLVTCGFAPLELVWGRDPMTGYVAPIGMIRADGSRGPGLIDRPAQNFLFTAEQEARFLTTIDPFMGEPIEPLKFIFLRDGSLNTEWGESCFTELYSSAWFYQQIRQMMLDAVEKFGRPRPHVLIPRGTPPEDIARIDAFYRENFGTYTRGLWDGDFEDVRYPEMPMAAAGAAGRSEIEVLRFFQGTFYIRLLRTQQTQDKTGGSRALETSRDARTDLVAVSYSDILCEGLQCGWMNPTMRINRPSLDPRLWARFVPDPTASEDAQTLHANLISGIDRGIPYSKEGYFKRFGLQEAKDAKDVLGHPKTSITDRTAEDPPAGDLGGEE